MEGYDHLVRMYELHPIGAPRRPEFKEVLRILFTPEEADLTRFMNFTLKKDEVIANEAGIGVAKARKLLEKMTKEWLHRENTIQNSKDRRA